MSDARQELMMMLYDPKRDGYESGSEGDFPVEERAIEALAAKDAKIERLREGYRLVGERFSGDISLLLDMLEAFKQESSQ